MENERKSVQRHFFRSGDQENKEIYISKKKNKTKNMGLVALYRNNNH